MSPIDFANGENAASPLLEDDELSSDRSLRGIPRMGRARRSDAAWPIVETARRSCVPAPCPERTTREMCLRSYLLHGRLLLKRRLRRGRGRESPVVNHFQALDVPALEDDRGVDLLAGGDLRADGSASLRAERSHCGSVRRDRRRSAIGKGRGEDGARVSTREKGNARSWKRRHSRDWSACGRTLLQGQRAARGVDAVHDALIPDIRLGNQAELLADVVVHRART